MNFYEELVHFYLTTIRQYIVLPEVPILHDVNGKPWEAYLDFLALGFKEPTIYLVEVTKHGGRPRVAERLSKANRENIESYVLQEILHNKIHFTIEWWFFVKHIHVEWVKKNEDYLSYLKIGGRCEVTALEDIFDQIKDRVP